MRRIQPSSVALVVCAPFWALLLVFAISSLVLGISTHSYTQIVHRLPRAYHLDPASQQQCVELLAKTLPMQGVITKRDGVPCCGLSLPPLVLPGKKTQPAPLPISRGSCSWAALPTASTCTRIHAVVGVMTHMGEQDRRSWIRDTWKRYSNVYSHSSNTLGTVLVVFVLGRPIKYVRKGRLCLLPKPYLFQPQNLDHTTEPKCLTQTCSPLHMKCLPTETSSCWTSPKT